MECGAEAPNSTLAADGVVLEAGLFDDLLVVDPPSVENDLLLQSGRDEVPVELLELVPLRHEDKSVRALGDVQGAVNIVDLREDLAHVVGSYGVVRLDPAALRQDIRDDHQRLRVANIVGVRLESQTKEPDRLALEFA